MQFFYYFGFIFTFLQFYFPERTKLLLGNIFLPPRNTRPRLHFYAEKKARCKAKPRSPENGFHIKTTFFYAGVGAHPCVRPRNITPFDFCAEKIALRKLNFDRPKIGFILKQRFLRREVGAHPCVRPRNITPFDFYAEKIARRKTKLRSPENGFHIEITFFTPRR